VANYFLDALAWHHIHDCWDASGIPARRKRIPSWSWAGWSGGVHYPERNDQVYTTKRKFTTHAELVMPSPEQLLRCAEMRHPSDLDQFKTVSLQTYPLPPDLLSYSPTAASRWKIGSFPAKVFLSTGAQTEAELYETIRNGQEVCCIHLGVAADCHRFWLIVKLNSDGVMYSRIGLLTSKMWNYQLLELRNSVTDKPLKWGDIRKQWTNEPFEWGDIGILGTALNVFNIG